MRLLDLVAQCRDPLVILPCAHGSQPIKVSGPSDFARTIVECPLRFVIADDLTRASAELAFADGDRLASCLDLLGIPAPLLWVEWSDAVHQQVLRECGGPPPRISLDAADVTRRLRSEHVICPARPTRITFCSGASPWPPNATFSVHPRLPLPTRHWVCRPRYRSERVLVHRYGRGAVPP